MTNFWKNLHRLTQDQMFAHGYLALSTTREIAAKRQTQDAREGTSNVNEKSRRNAPWPRLAAMR